MGDATEAFMIELLRFFVRPNGVERDVDGGGSYLQGGRNVALEAVAHHHQLLRTHLQLLAEMAICLRRLVAYDAHHIEISLQARTPQLVFLVHQLALREDCQAILSIARPCV